MMSSLSIQEQNIFGRPLGLLLVLLFFYLLSGLLLSGVPEIASSTEAREVHVSRVILDRNEWVMPRRNGVVPSKPPLAHWLAASLGACVGGVTPGVQRAVSLFASVGLLVLTFFLGWFLAVRDGFCGEQRTGVALVATIILGSTSGFFRLALDARVDMVFAFFVVGAVASFLVPLFSGVSFRESKDWGIPSALSALSMGLAVLTKGPLGILLPGLILFAVFSTSLGLGATLRAVIRPRIAWLVLILVAAPWFIAGYLQVGDEFLTRYVFENYIRAVGGDFITAKPWYYYFETLIQRASPWSLVFFIFVVRAWWLGERYESESRGQRVCLVWFVVGFLFFSICSGKRHAYLLPLYPAMALVLSVSLVRAVRTAKTQTRMLLRERFTLIPIFFLVLTFLVLCLFALTDAGLLRSSPELRVAAGWMASRRVVFVGSCLLAGVLFLLALSQQVQIRRIGFQWSGTMVLLFTCLSLGLGLKAEYKGFALIARSLQEMIPQQQKLVVVKHRSDELFDPALLYFGREVEIVSPKSPGALERDYALMRRFQLKELLARRSLHPGEFQTVALYRQLPDKIRSRTDRDLVLIYIDPIGTLEGVA